MASRPLAGPYPVIGTFNGQNSGVSGSMATSITSEASIIPNLSMMSYSYSWTGTTPVGTISVQVSNDYSQNSDGTARNAGTWNTITFNLNGAPVMSAPVTGNTGNGFIDLDSTGAYAIRTVYTAVSGTGSLISIFAAKVA